MGNEKIFFIGLDAADPNLLESWIKQGQLPFFAKLMREGTYARLKCIPPTFSPVEWTSILTGTNPGKHGIFGFVKTKNGSRQILNQTDRKSTTFYEILAASGKRVGLVNMVMTYPATEINGFMITGMETPDLNSPGISYPQGLIEELRAAGCQYQISPGISGLIMQGKVEEAISAVHTAVDERYKATNYLMQKYDCDLMVVLFSQIDNCGHYFWRFYDKLHPAYTEAEGERFGNVMLQLYQKHEQILQDLMGKYPEATFIICSDHGMGFNYEARYYTRELFIRLGWYIPGDALQGQLSPKRLAKRQVKNLYWAIYKHFPMHYKQKMAGLFPGLRRRVASTVADVGWDKTRAYSNDEFVSIVINKNGKNGKRFFPSEKTYFDFRDEIIAKLYALKDLDTGQPLARKVYTREELYHGDHVADGPDLIIEWADVRVRNGVQCGDITILPQEIEKNALHEILTGEHRPQGILLIKGGAFQKDRWLADGSVLDIAPTLLYLTRQPIPRTIDGKVLLAAFRDSFLADNPVGYTDIVLNNSAKNGFSLSVEETLEVAERFRNLGYIE